MVFNESYYLPDELIDYVDEKIIDRLDGKKLWYMTARDDNLLGTVIYSIMPDKENAILEYLYITDGFNDIYTLLEKSMKALKDHHISKVSVFLDERYWDKEIIRGMSEGLDKVSTVSKYHYYRYDYLQLMEGDIVANLDEVQVYTNEVGYIDSVEDADAWDVRDILEDIGVPFVIHEQNNGIGRYYLDENKKLIGVALGRSDEGGNFFITDYYDSENRENTRAFRKVILSIINDFLSDSFSSNYMEILCSNDSMEQFLKRNFGDAGQQGDVFEYTIGL